MAFFNLQLNQFGICQVLFDECVDFNPTLYDISIYHKMVKIYINVLERYLKTLNPNPVTVQISWRQRFFGSKK